MKQLKSSRKTKKRPRKLNNKSMVLIEEVVVVDISREEEVGTIRRHKRGSITRDSALNKIKTHTCISITMQKGQYTRNLQ